MKNLAELRSMTIDELKAEVLGARKQQFNLRLKKANGSLEKTHPVTLLRKQVARIKTIMTEKVGTGHGK